LSKQNSNNVYCTNVISSKNTRGDKKCYTVVRLIVA